MLSSMHVDLRSLYPSFPRDMGSPERHVVFNHDQMMKFVAQLNGLKPVFVSVYSSDELNRYDKANLDKMFFDFDGDTAYEQMLKMHTMLLNEDIFHIVNFSGGGFHILVFCKNGSQLRNPKRTVWNVQDHLCRKAMCEMDRQVKGDLARLMRFPGTWNPRRQKFCIPLTQSDILNGKAFIEGKAASFGGCLEFEAFGTKYFDVLPFDSATAEEAMPMIETQLPDNVGINGIDQATFDKFPLCIQHMLKTPNLRWKGRYHLITFLKESAYSRADVIEILRHTLSKEKFTHCVVEERQVDYVFNKDFMMADCEVLQQDGYRAKGCQCHCLYKRCVA